MRNSEFESSKLMNQAQEVRFTQTQVLEKIKYCRLTGVKDMDKKTFKEFKDFLAEECFDLEKYKQGKYDRKIYNWHTKAVAKEKMELVERIEGMKKEGQLRDVPTDRGTGGVNYGLTTPTRVLSLNDKLYNQALSDVISTLKSEEKEEVG